ncbi:PREDICTED: calcium-binding protein PBP1-like [Nelumbo nucifera]|uniref:EF-hand domain-containing protein n=2 Tax=Nelumbo nucifera TaxID=4432 RepID=A0A822XTT1_NELNU|nr:PREDICTED: calcium-binding protein PBP1-like [Nelumbo nucifera]DAD23133.1 TPA_asm: hypothetical protein HUJ06_024596 [Nelumbo nucifera]
MDEKNDVVFEDYFPSMVERIGADRFIAELCQGFCLLMDHAKGLITFESLKRSASLLGVHDLEDDDLFCMLKEGDLDGDGALSQREFCVLMCTLSFGFMNGSRKLLLEETISNVF